MSALSEVQYDESFIMTSNGYYAEVEGLRMARAALDQKYSNLSLLRSEAIMKHDDLSAINAHILEVQIERRKINDLIDVALEKHLGYIRSNTHHTRRVG